MNMSKKRNKYSHELVARTSICLPPAVFTWGLQHMQQDAFKSFSEYVQDLIRQRERAKSSAV